MDKRKSLGKLNKDTCNIYEYQSQENEYGITKQDWVLVHENIKCSISKKSLNNINQTDKEAIISDARVLFLDDRINILKGSKVICRDEIMYAGKPFIYEGSHQEVPLSTKEYA